MSTKGQINTYTCNTGHQTITIDKDDGTTSMMIECQHPECNKDAKSAYYKCEQSLIPSHEWYKPLNTIGFSTAVKEHVEKGGLLLREIVKAEEPEQPEEKQPVLHDGFDINKHYVFRQIQNHLADLDNDFDVNLFGVAEVTLKNGKTVQVQVLLEDDERAFVEIEQAPQGKVNYSLDIEIDPHNEGFKFFTNNADPHAVLAVCFNQTSKHLQSIYDISRKNGHKASDLAGLAKSTYVINKYVSYYEDQAIKIAAEKGGHAQAVEETKQASMQIVPKEESE